MKIRPVDVMVLTVLVVIIANVLYPSFGEPGPNAMLVACKAYIADISQALDTFAEHVGRFPTMQEGLNALVTCPQSLTMHQWRGPYVSGARTLQDPWGRDFLYECPGRHRPQGFDLYSLGQDHASESHGDDLDDINNWDMEKLFEGRYSIRRRRHNHQAEMSLAMAVIGVGFTLLTWVRRRRCLTNA